MTAEKAYLFRHALLRDAAYQLQLPGDRARLHALAFAVIEALAGGRAPEPAPLDAVEEVTLQPHATVAFAQELALHARLAEVERGLKVDPIHSRPRIALQRLYLRRAAEHADKQFRPEVSRLLWERHAALVKAGVPPLDEGGE
ncbi:MAG: hypothetical protein AAB074_06580 [Planctomycetota bacterium]